MTLQKAVEILEAEGIKVRVVDEFMEGRRIQGIKIGSSPIVPVLEARIIKGMKKADLIKTARNSLEPILHGDGFSFIDAEYILDNCVSCIRPETNDNTDVKWSVYGNLEEYVRLGFNMLDSKASWINTVVTHQMLDYSGVSKAELRNAARKNLRSMVTIEPMADAFARMNPGGEELEPNEKMYVASVNTHVYGASVMMLDDVLQGFCEEHNLKSLYIIPSSIHEVLLSWVDIPIEEYNSQIVSTNETLRESERLSDHVYTFIAK